MVERAIPADVPQIVVASSDVSGYPVNGLNSQFFAYDIKKTAN